MPAAGCNGIFARSNDVRLLFSILCRLGLHSWQPYDTVVTRSDVSFILVRRCYRCHAEKVTSQ